MKANHFVISTVFIVPIRMARSYHAMSSWQSVHQHLIVSTLRPSIHSRYTNSKTSIASQKNREISVTASGAPTTRQSSFCCRRVLYCRQPRSLQWTRFRSSGSLHCGTPVKPIIMLIDCFSSGLANRPDPAAKPGKPGSSFSQPVSKTD